MRLWLVLVSALVPAAWVLPAQAVEREPQEAYRKVLLPGLVRVRFFDDARPAQVEALLRGLGLSVARRGDDYWVLRASNPADLPRVLRALNSSPLVEWAVPHYALVPLREPLTPIKPQTL